MKRVAFLAVYAAACTNLSAPPNTGPSVVALFDPTATPPVAPQPTDLAFQGGDGVHLHVPIASTVSMAEREFLTWLNSLDGFPGTLDASTTFSGALDPASLKVHSATSRGGIVILDRDSNQLVPGSASLSADGKKLSITPAKRWRPGGHYAVGLFGGNDPDPIRGKNGETVLSSQTFFFLRADKPLVARCGDGTTNDCLCPPSVLQKAFLPGFNDTTCHALATGLPDLASAEKAELLRLSFNNPAKPVIPLLLQQGTRDRSNLVLAFTFTIASSPLIAFDPTHGDVPFPNDVLIDQTTHRVNVPIATGDPQAAIKMQLNQLDGFSTTAAETVSIDTMDGMAPVASTVAAGVQMVNVTMSTISTQPTWTAAPVLVQSGAVYAGQIAVQPSGALLPDQNRYAVVVANTVTDSAARPLIPSPPMVLLKSDNPLFDGTHSTVSLLDDASAAQLETLRKAYQPLWGLLQLRGLSRDKIAQVWTFTTQSVARPLNALVEYPTAAALPTDVTITHVTDPAALTAAASSLNYPVTNVSQVVFGTFQSKNLFDSTLGHIAFDRTQTDPTDPSLDRFHAKAPTGAPATTVGFVLTLPKTGNNGVAVIQHGLGAWRGVGVQIADAYAAQGWATIAIDVGYHGVRSVCTKDAECVGTCNTTSGVCSGGFAPASTVMDPFACTLKPLLPAGDTTGCRPLISGNGFIDTASFFHSRDNLRQHVVDLAQLMRVLGAAGGSSLSTQLGALTAPATLGAGRAYLGQSLGSILGTAFLAATPTPLVAYLSVPGGDVFDIFATGSYHAVVDNYLVAIGVQRDTPAYFSLVQNARWILDPADPLAVGQFLRQRPMTSYLTGTRNAQKLVLQQEAGLDTTIPDQFQEALALQIFGARGLDASHHVQSVQLDGTIVSTYWPTALHGSLFDPTPSTSDQHITTGMQTQAATWAATAGATITPSLTN